MRASGWMLSQIAHHHPSSGLSCSSSSICFSVGRMSLQQQQALAHPSAAVLALLFPFIFVSDLETDVSHGGLVIHFGTGILHFHIGRLELPTSLIIVRVMRTRRLRNLIG